MSAFIPVWVTATVLLAVGSGTAAYSGRWVLAAVLATPASVGVAGILLVWALMST